MTLILFLAVCFLAYTNGANDNFKGVATLYGSRTVGYKTAICWGTLCTLVGSVCSILLAQSLLKSFSGKGLVPDELVGSEHFLVAVAVGAGTTVLIATLTGLPISTTHSLVGGLVGSGLMATSGSVSHQVLASTFFGPLLLSPLMALLLGATLYAVLRFARLKMAVTKEWCICIGNQERTVPIPQPNSLLAADEAGPDLSLCIDDATECEQRYRGRFLGVKLQALVDGGHFVSAGIVSFARGLNDTPKIAALLLIVQALDIRWGLLAIAAVMAAGGLLGARKVAETMGHRITEMNHGQAVSANIATGLLVIIASRFGLPVSTTHVSVGSLFGIGMVTRSIHYRAAGGIVLSWLVTLPCAGLIGAITYSLLR